MLYVLKGCAAVDDIAVWSKGIYNIRAKIIRGSAGIVSFSISLLTGEAVPVDMIYMLEVCCSRKIAAGFQGILDSRAKVGVCSVMLAGSREIVCRYAGMCISCSVDHHELYFYFQEK